MGFIAIFTMMVAMMVVIIIMVVVVITVMVVVVITLMVVVIVVMLMLMVVPKRVFVCTLYEWILREITSSVSDSLLTDHILGRYA